VAWLEIHQSIKDHRKLLAAADALDMAPAHVAGHIIFFWLWALDNAPSGEISDISARNIARAAQWEGSPESFLSALVESGLVDKTGERLFIHDWSDYAGKLIDQRVADRERKRQSRASAKAKNSDSVTCPENVQRTSVGQNKDVQGKSVATVQNTTVQNTTAKNTRESSGGAPYCDEDISFDSDCNQMPENDRFERFWSAYPRKTGKKEAIEAWKRINPDEDMTETIIAGLERWKQSKQWTDDNGQYIPYPASFLSKERWNDECQPAIDKKVPAAKNYDDDEDFLGTGGASP
jgi:hypothetical protein